MYCTVPGGAGAVVYSYIGILILLSVTDRRTFGPIA